MKPINNYSLRKAIAWCIAILLLLAFVTADWWLPGPSDIAVEQAMAADLVDAVAQANVQP